MVRIAKANLDNNRMLLLAKDLYDLYPEMTEEVGAGVPFRKGLMQITREAGTTDVIIKAVAGATLPVGLAAAAAQKVIERQQPVDPKP